MCDTEEYKSIQDTKACGLYDLIMLICACILYVSVEKGPEEMHQH